MTSKKIIRTVLLCAVLVLSMAGILAVGALADEGEHVHDGITFTAWESTDALPTEAGNYYLTTDVTLSGGWYIHPGTAVRLCLNGHTISSQKTSTVITIYQGSSLTLYDCKDGGAVIGKTLNAIDVKTGGELVLNGGTISTNGSSKGVNINSDATFIMNGGIITKNYGGVSVGSGASFTMTGGTISNNGGFGGVDVDGTFTMNGGTISGNNGRGVDVSNDFTMTGGTISGNNGRGVDVDGSFTMTGGTISNNDDCGVSVDSGASFTMTGGTISDNSGSGVAVYGTFIMTSGTISGNTATGEGGGGVFVRGTFTMNGGIISGNTSTRWGGGISVREHGLFTMNGGSISDNASETNIIAEYGGGGVFLIDSTFIMNGGIISGNTSTRWGGGVHAVGDSTFTMKGGKITGNTVTDNYDGGGVSLGYINTYPITTANFSGSFNISGDVRITGNLKGGNASNVSFYPGRLGGKITVTDSLSQNASIGISPYFVKEVVTSGLSAHGGNINAFFCDDEENRRIIWDSDHKEAIVTWYDPPEITKSPKNQTVLPGQSVTFAVTATGERLSYQWEYSTNNGSTWKTWSGKTTASVTVKASESNNGILYRCIVSNSAGTVYSSDAKLALIVVPVIKTQPKASTVPIGESAVFSVKAEGYGLTYQWQYSKDNGSVWNNWSGKTASSASVTAGTGNDGCLYRVIVANAAGSVTSSSAKLTTITKPVITAQPKAVTAANGNSASFSVTATGIGLTYQWQYSKDNGSTWSNWSGKTASSASATAGTGNNGNLYRVVVKNAAGSVTSAAAKLTVIMAPVITAQPKDTSVVKGDTATFSVAASGTGLKYQWYYSADNGATWKTPSFACNTAVVSMTATATQNGYLFRCVVSNIAGNVTSSSAKLAVSSHTHDGIAFFAWESTNSLPQTAGNYTLTADVKLSEPWIAPAGETRIDLCGHKITLNGLWIEIDSGNKFYLYDCKNTGIITGGKRVLVSSNAQFTMNGGTISGNTGTYDQYGVYVDSGNFKMNGGTISDNSGGGVYVYDGTFTMKGGTISKNKASNRETAVDVSSGTFIMNGGTISNNGGGGVGVSGSESTFTMKGGTISNNGGRGVYVSNDFTMTGGTISDNNGRGVDVSNDFTMTGGTISGNNGRGADVIGTFTMTGGTISGNTASEYGGGVLASVFKVRGNVRVTGNTGNGKVSNVLLNGKPIAVTGVLAGTASIGVTGDEFDQVTSGLSAHGGNIGAFFSDDVSRNYIGWNEEHTDAVLIDSVPHMSGGYGGIPVDVNYGDVAVFSASATGYELTYQWQYSKDNGTTWNNLTGKTAATLTVKATDSNDENLYRVMVTNKYGSDYDWVQLYTIYKTVIKTQPKSVRVANTLSAHFSVTATGKNLAYQWQYRKAGETAWKTWSGKTTAEVSVKATEANSGNQYRCYITSDFGNLYSSVATLTTVMEPVITEGPKAVSANEGESISFTVKISGIVTSYQWQYSKDNGATWNTWSGKTASTASATAGSGNNGYYYRCAVKNEYGTTYSGKAKLTVILKPRITTQPKAISAVKGTTATFTVTATGTKPTYQWQYSKDNGATWNTWSGKTASTASATAGTGNNGYLYRVIVKNAAGSVTSSSAKLTTITKPVIKTQPKDVSVVKGNTATFSVTATGIGLTYQWQYSKDNGAIWNTWSGKTASSVTATAGSNSGWLYRCIVKNAAGSVTSSAAKLTVTAG